MVAVSLDYVVNNIDDSSEDTTFTATMTASAALANTDQFFVLSMVNFRPETDGTNAQAQLETRFGTTRIGLSAFWNAFMQFNTGDAASAVNAGCMAVLTGDGSDTINYRQRSVNATTGRGNRVGGQQLSVINLTEFGVENTDWFYSETTNEDAASATPTGTTFVRAGGTALGTNVVQSGELEFTPGATGDYQLVAYVEGFFTASATAAENTRARLVMVEDPDGAATTTTIAYEEVVGYASNAADPEDIRRPFLFFDARELTSGTEYRFQIEVGNTGTATETDYGRFRILAMRLARWTAYAFITNANNATAASGEDACDNDLTFNFSGDAHDVLVLANSASASDETNWGHRVLREDPGGTPVNYPDAEGRFNAFNGAEQFPSYHMACLEGNTGSTTMQMLVATDGSDTHRYGQNLAESAAVRGFLAAIMLDVPDAAITLTPASIVAQWTVPAPTIVLSTVTVTPTALREAWTLPAPAVVPGAITALPAALQGQWNVPAATVLLVGGPITLTPSTLRALYTFPTPVIVSTVLATVVRNRFTFPAPVVVPGTATRTPAALRSQYVFPTAMVVGGVTGLVSPLGVTVSTSPAFDVTVATSPAFGLTVQDD